MKTRTWIAGVASASLAASVALVAAGSGLTVANAVITLPSVGTITLNTDSGASQLTWSSTDSALNTVDPITLTSGTTTCSLGNASNSLLSLAGYTSSSAATSSTTTATLGTAATVGYKTGQNGNSIGVTNARNNAKNCAQVDQATVAEQLLIGLGTGIPNTTGSAAPQFFQLNLDMDLKASAVVQATFYKADGSVITDPANSNRPITWTLYSGKNLATGTLAANQFNCSATVVADSGSDSGSSDNCRWIISPGFLFSSVTLRPTAGNFSLEGGGDYATAQKAANRSEFLVANNYEGVLDCGDTATEQTNNGATTTGTAKVVSIYRYNQNGDTTPCLLIPYNIALEQGGVQFLKPLGDTQGTAQFVAILQTEVLPGTLPVTLTRDSTAFARNITGSTVDWEDGSTTPPSSYALPWCPKGVMTGYNTDGYPSIDYSKITSNMDASSVYQGKQYACQYDIQAKLLASGNQQITYKVYFTGDIRIKA